MSGPQRQQIPDVRAADPATAFQRMRSLGKRVLAVPKREIEAAAAAAKRKTGKPPKRT